MTYPEVLDYMYKQLPMFHRVGQSAYKADLNTATYLDDYFQKPHRHYQTIHVAGTNGKGSVSHMLAGILQKAGYKTGLFTSPHLKDFRERLRVNGSIIPQEEVIEFIRDHKDTFDKIKPSFFEMTSALAFYYFAKAQCDIAVIEVGLGGRLDSTNIITPALSVITNIGYDHMDLLGDTLAKIAAEKAGIIKKEVPVVAGEYHPETWPVFEQVSQQNHSSLVLAERRYKADFVSHAEDGKQILKISGEEKIIFPELKLDLLGFYQRKNVCTVLAAVDELRKQGLVITDENVREALSQIISLTGLQGRWQRLGEHPLVICDTGHNKDGFLWITRQIESIPCNRLHMVIGFVKDKDITAILQLLPAHAVYYFTNAAIPRALNAEELKERASKYGLKGNSYPSVKQALEEARKNASEEDFIFIGGSTFVVAEVI